VGTGCSIHISHSASVKAGCHRLSHGPVYRQYVIRHECRTRTPLVLFAQLR
jgi:hypothetical protein